MKKKLLFLTMSATILTACASSQPNDDQNSSSSVSSSVSEESSQASSAEESVSSESIEEESSSVELTWSSMDEAIDFYENKLIADMGEELAGIELNGEFYERDMWELVQNEGDTIVLFKPNIGRGDGGQNIEFVKGEENTELTFFEPDAPYPEKPLSKQIVRNEDYVIIETENLSPLAWESMEEAIDFYENTYNNPENELSKDFVLENYDRDDWEVEFTAGKQIALHWINAGGAGGYYMELVRDEEYTDLLVYEGNDSYPGTPKKQYTVQNDTFQIVSTEEFED